MERREGAGGALPPRRSGRGVLAPALTDDDYVVPKRGPSSDVPLQTPAGKVLPWSSRKTEAWQG